MAYSTKTYPSDGLTTDFSITFDYLDASHVRVSVGKVLTTAVGSPYKVVFNNATNIRVDTVIDGDPVPAGVDIKIFRETPIDTPAVVFGGGAGLTSSNLNKNSEYLTFALQEATDANEGFTKLYLGSFTTDPLVDNEGAALLVGAVYYNSTDTALNYWTGSTWIVGESTAAASVFSDAAEAARDAAVVAKDAAEAAATTASSDASATIAAAVASTAADVTAASGSAAAAAASETAAASSETAAAASETAAAASAASITQIGVASQAEAEAGVENTKAMTALRTKQAIDAAGVTTAAVLAATAGATAGEVGTYMFCVDNRNFSVGTTYAGSVLRPGGLAQNAGTTSASGGNAQGHPYNSGATLLGTWRAMGTITASYTARYTLFLRII